MENLTKQGKSQGANTEQEEPKFNQWQIEPRENGRKPLEIRTIDKLNGADVGILLCKTEQESDAKLILKAVNMHDKLIKMLSEIKENIKKSEEWWMDSPDKGGFDLVKIEQLLKQAEQK